MALSYHHQYNHPVLWSDQERRLEERRIASESLAIIQQQKKQAELEKNREAIEVSEFSL